MTAPQINDDARAFLVAELDELRARAVAMLDTADPYARAVLAGEIASLDRVRVNPPEVVLVLATALQRARNEVTP